jgi:hypothetical protein
MNDVIDKHFNGFVHFDYSTTPIKRIGNVSKNGFVMEIPYIHRGYKAYAVLKSAMNYFTDNLLYEYVVGKFINKYNKIFPCFLETYGYYTYNSNDVWDTMKTTVTINNNDILKNGLTFHKQIDYNMACAQSKYLAILIQHLKDVKSFKHMCLEESFLKNELLNMLFQVYFPLHILGKKFTHYDLHYENVLIYEPKINNYIQFYYHLNGNVISFKSRYIAKIIDYGRSHFEDNENRTNSSVVHNEICSAKSCNTAKYKCGSHVGFSWLKENIPNEHNSWICPKFDNCSHDLRLLYAIRQIKLKNMPPHLDSFLNKVEYSTKYGTPANKKSGLPTKIFNVDDAFQSILIMMNQFERLNKIRAVYATYKKLGDLHIYDDGRPMKFMNHT